MFLNTWAAQFKSVNETEGKPYYFVKVTISTRPDCSAEIKVEVLYEKGNIESTFDMPAGHMGALLDNLKRAFYEKDHDK